jgi:hypothetical protein
MPFELVHEVAAPDMMPFTDDSPDARAVMALDIATKYQFHTPGGDLYHEYHLPSSREIQNCGGYIDKLLKYRSPEIRDFILGGPASLSRFLQCPWAVLHGRSPRIDLILNDLIGVYRRGRNERVSLLDHGCTVAEHYDLIDLLLQASTGEKAGGVLAYVGIDHSPLVLSAARLLHPSCLGPNFRLILGEGSDLSFSDDRFDFSVSVGVVNHVARPLETMNHLLRITRIAFATVVWVTGEAKGFWAFNHSGVGNYFFAERDLAALAHQHPKGRFLFAEFVPERESTQPMSYVGIDENRIRQIGSYILVYSSLPDPPEYLQPLLLAVPR